VPTQSDLISAAGNYASEDSGLTCPFIAVGPSDECGAAATQTIDLCNELDAAALAGRSGDKGLDATSAAFSLSYFTAALVAALWFAVLL